MEEKYYLVKQLTNDKGQDGSSISVYPSKEKALVAYHQTLATYINATDVLYAVCYITNYEGVIFYSETVDHRPAPEVTES
jgi:hypothetical protein